MVSDRQEAVDRLTQWSARHSNVTPLDGADRFSPTFGDLRQLLTPSPTIGAGDGELLEQLQCPQLSGRMSTEAHRDVQAMADTMELAADRIEQLLAALGNKGE